MKGLLFVACLATGLFNAAYGQYGEVYGTVVDETEEAIISAQVVLYKNGAVAGAALTGFDGYFSVRPLAEGTYDASISYLGYQRDSVSAIPVSVNGGTRMISKLEPLTERQLNGRPRFSIPTPDTFTRHHVYQKLAESWNPTSLTICVLPSSSRNSSERPVIDRNHVGPKPARPLSEPTMPGSRTVITAKELERMPY